jgi:DNA-binding transcriptional MerR regulator
MSSKVYTTAEAAAKANITRATLQAWIKLKKVLPPKPVLDGARAKRLWTESDVNRLRAAKEKHFGKGKTGRPTKK